MEVTLLFLIFVWLWLCSGLWEPRAGLHLHSGPVAAHSGVAAMSWHDRWLCKGEVGAVHMCPPTLSITGTTTAVPREKDGRVWQRSAAGSL